MRFICLWGCPLEGLMSALDGTFGGQLFISHPLLKEQYTPIKQIMSTDTVKKNRTYQFILLRIGYFCN